jgi:hypothetical protein
MAVRKDPTAEVLETIAAMSDRDRAVAERLHEVITAADRSPSWYGGRWARTPAARTAPP